LTPPDGLSAAEQEAFADLVLGTPADRFQQSDLPLLAALARAIVGERLAAAELAKAPVIDDKASPWLLVWQARVRALTALSRLLGVAPSRRPKAEKHSAPVSYIDRLQLLRGPDDDDEEEAGRG
jgi:hypothetical protein